MHNELPDEMKPWTGSFELSVDGKDALLDCMPNTSDTAAITKQKLSRLTTYVYILMDSTYCDEDGPVKY